MSLVLVCMLERNDGWALRLWCWTLVSWARKLTLAVPPPCRLFSWVPFPDVNKATVRLKPEAFTICTKKGRNGTVPEALPNSVRSDSASLGRLSFERNDRSEWNGPYATTKFFCEEWGEYGFTNSTGIFRSFWFSLEWAVHKTFQMVNVPGWQVDVTSFCVLYQLLCFQVCDIGDASKGSLSSYAYILMLLHYLQQCQPPVIPVLQTLHTDSKPPEKIIDGWNCWFLSDLKKIVGGRALEGVFMWILVPVRVHTSITALFQTVVKSFFLHPTSNVAHATPSWIGWRKPFRLLIRYLFQSAKRYITEMSSLSSFTRYWCKCWYPNENLDSAQRPGRTCPGLTRSCMTFGADIMLMNTRKWTYIYKMNVHCIK